MYNYFLYTARRIVEEFERRWKIDPQKAREYLKQKLKKSPSKVRQLTIDILASRYPEVKDDQS